MMFGDAPLPPLAFPASLGSLGRFGDFELLGEIARGGMGIVYRAQQISLGRLVAIKLLRDGALASSGEAERFRAEAAAAAGLRHSHIVAVHEIGEHDGQLFFSMDLVEGRDLAELTREGPLPALQAARLVVQVSEAMQYAHEQGILHRDLKPSNVIVDATGEARVTDFGLARRTDAPSELTVSGQILGTPGYMAPEQAAGRQRELSVTSDTYSLGALLYHLLTARAPFVGETPAVVLRQVEEKEPVAPRMLNPAVPRDLETIALKALSKDVAGRYSTAADLARDLERFLRGEPVLARPVSQFEHGWRWCRRNPAVATSAALSLGLLLAAVGVVSAASIRLSAQRREAEQVKRFLQEILSAPDPNVDGRNVRVIDVLERARRRATNELTAQPLVLAEVQTTLGTTYYQLALYEEAEPLLRSALALYERELGADALKTAEAQYLVGALLTWAGDSPAALEKLRAAEAVFRRHPETKPAQMASLLAELGSAFVSAGKNREAVAPLQECVDVCRKVGSALDATRAGALGDLATAVWDLGDPDWRNYLEEAIELNRGLPGGKVNLATCLSNLADSLLEEGQLERAETAAREAVSLRQELFGTNSSPTAFALARLGTVFLAQSNYPAALTAANQAVKIDDEILPPDHRDFQFSLRLQGRTLNLLNRPAEAEPILRRAGEIARQAYGPDHPTVHGLAALLAESLVALKRSGEAQSLLEAAVPVMRESIKDVPPGSRQRQRFVEFEQLLERLRQEREPVPTETTIR